MKVRVNQSVFFWSVSIFFLFSTIVVKSQKLKDYEYTNTREVRILSIDSVITADVKMVDDASFKIKDQKVYHWYYSNKIWTNEGAFDGQLLHGVYKIKDKEGRLIKLGYFENGLKVKSWVTWYQNGQKSKVENWKKGEQAGKEVTYFGNGNLLSEYSYKSGKKNGKYKVYNAKEVLIEKGSYKAGNKNGWITRFDEKGVLLDKVKYKEGVLVEPKQEDESKKSSKVKETKGEKKTKEVKPRKKLNFWKKRDSTIETN